MYQVISKFDGCVSIRTHTNEDSARNHYDESVEISGGQACVWLIGIDDIAAYHIILNDELEIHGATILEECEC